MGEDGMTRTPEEERFLEMLDRETPTRKAIENIEKAVFQEPERLGKILLVLAQEWHKVVMATRKDTKSAHSCLLRDIFAQYSQKRKVKQIDCLNMFRVAMEVLPEPNSPKLESLMKEGLEKLREDMKKNWPKFSGLPREKEYYKKLFANEDSNS
jgi:hypothetical protein